MLAAIDRLTPEGGTSLGRACDLAHRHRRQDRAARRARDSSVEPQGPDIGYYGSAAVVLLSDGENTAGPDPLESAELASIAGVQVYPIGLGSAAGTVLEIDGFQRRHGARRAAAARRSRPTDGHVLRRRGRGLAGGGLRRHRPELDDAGQADRGHRPARRRGALLLLVGAGLSLVWFGRVV